MFKCYRQQFVKIQWTDYYRKACSNILSALCSCSEGLLQCVWRWSGGGVLWRCRSPGLSCALLLLLLSGFSGRHWRRGRQLLVSRGGMWAGRELVHHPSAVFHGWRQSSGPAGDQSTGEPSDRASQYVRVRRSQPSSTTWQWQHPWAINFKVKGVLCVKVPDGCYHRIKPDGFILVCTLRKKGTQL